MIELQDVTLKALFQFYNYNDNNNHNDIYVNSQQFHMRISLPVSPSLVLPILGKGPRLGPDAL